MSLSPGSRQVGETGPPTTSPPHAPTSLPTQPPGESGRAHQVISPEDWPQVTEPTYDPAASAPSSGAEAGAKGEHSASSQGRGRGDLGSRGSERHSLARRLLDEGVKGESPAPPPPSPEPKEPKEVAPPRPNRSRDSAVMEPLLEQTESEASVSPEKRSQGERSMAVAPPAEGEGKGRGGEGVIQEEGGSAEEEEGEGEGEGRVVVTQVAPTPGSRGSRGQQTFVQVDIPAEDLSSLHAQQGSTPLHPASSPSSPSLSPAKLSTPKSSAGPASPVRKSPLGHSGARRPSKGRKNGSGPKDRGEDQGQ